MSRDDLLLMQQAASKIRELRRENEVLRAKVDTMDLFAVVLMTAPTLRVQGVEVDIAWELEKRVDQIREEAERA